MNDDLKANELPAGAGSPCGGAAVSTTSVRAVSMDVLTYATVCSGIECMSVACIGLPLRPVFFSEIEPFPCAVLKAHYPDVPNLGDMSKIQVSENGLEITNGTTTIRLHERLGILAGGTPCQDVSVAGKRAGMQEGSGTRSSLAFDFVRLARELRPRWVLWENVAGSIDSKNAPDFLRFASALGDCGYSLAWRVLDAQYVRVDGMERAVPQRRRRVWVVGCLGADESLAGKILFEPDCVAGRTPPRRRAGQGFAYALAGRDRVDAGVVGEPAGCDVLNFQGSKGNNCVTDDGSCPNLNAMHGHDVHVVALDGDKIKPREDQRKGGNGFGINEEGAGYTLTGVDRHGVAYETECYENHAQDSRVKPIEVSDTRNQKDGTGGNNLPLVVMAYRPPIQDLISEACAKYGADWPDDDWAEITDEVTLNIYIDMDGKRRATAFQKSDTNLEFGVDISYVGDGATGKCKCFSKVSHPKAKDGDGERWDEREVAQTRNTFDNGEKRCQEVVVSTNSNGGDVAATLTRDLAKQTGAQQQNGGGYVLTRQKTSKSTTTPRKISPTIRSTDYKEPLAVVIPQERERAMGIGRDVIECGKAAKFAPDIQDECSPTIRAKAPSNGVMIAKEGAEGEVP